MNNFTRLMRRMFLHLLFKSRRDLMHTYRCKIFYKCRHKISLARKEHVNISFLRVIFMDWIKLESTIFITIGARVKWS